MKTPHRLFGQNRRGVVHHVGCLAKTDVVCCPPRRFWPNNQRSVVDFSKAPRRFLGPN